MLLGCSGESAVLLAWRFLNSGLSEPCSVTQVTCFIKCAAPPSVIPVSQRMTAGALLGNAVPDPELEKVDHCQPPYCDFLCKGQVVLAQELAQRAHCKALVGNAVPDPKWGGKGWTTPQTQESPAPDSHLIESLKNCWRSSRKGWGVSPVRYLFTT